MHMEKLKYRFDQIMTRGVPAQLGLLAVVSLLFVLSATIVLALCNQQFSYFGEPVQGILELYWTTLLHTLDPAAAGGDEGPWGIKIMLLMVSIGGIATMGAIIGIISAGIEEKMDELRKGRSKVVEKDHICILGWDARVPEIVNELALANEETGGKKSSAKIAILANRDIDRMEEDLDDVELRTSSLILRRGNPIDQADLAKLNIASARSIIIPAPISPTGNAEVTKTLLALSKSANQNMHHIVAELTDYEAYSIAHSVTPDANLLCAGEIVSKIIAQSVIEPGLTEVYQDLLDFAGSEFYPLFLNESHLAVGMNFKELVLSCRKQIPVGLVDQTGRLELIPDMEKVIEPGMSVIALAEDDIGLEVERADLDIPKAPVKRDTPVAQKKALILAGENKKLPIIKSYLSNKGLEVVDTAYPENMEFVPGIYDMPDVQTIILLTDEGTSTHVADATVMTSLIRLRSLNTDKNIIAEILDPKNIDLMWSARADDCIASYQLSAYALCQTAENPVLIKVIQGLLCEDNVKLKIRPVADYLEKGTFLDLTVQALARGEIALGFFPNDQDEPIINPYKSIELPVSEACRAVVLEPSP
jgi:hypothetical protein